MNRIEVDAGRCRDVRPFQHIARKIEAVAGKFRHIRVKIERAVGRKERVEPGLGQAFDQDAAVVLIAALDDVHLGAAVKGGLRRNLRQRRHRDRKVLL